jgi:hypothetical protein
LCSEVLESASGDTSHESILPFGACRADSAGSPHDCLAEYSGNTKLQTTYRRLINELDLFRLCSLAQEGALPKSYDEHRAVLKAIAAARPNGNATVSLKRGNVSGPSVHRRRANMPSTERSEIVMDLK